MNERGSQFTIIVGASPIADGLRRRLARLGMAHAGFISHPRLLRRALVRSAHDLTVVCVAMDGQMVRRYGSGLRVLLADGEGFSTAIRSLGLLGEAGLTPETAELGCDVYASSPAQALRGVWQLSDHWWHQVAGASWGGGWSEFRGRFGGNGIWRREPVLRDESIGLAPLKSRFGQRQGRLAWSMPIERLSRLRDDRPQGRPGGSSRGINRG